MKARTLVVLVAAISASWALALWYPENTSKFLTSIGEPAVDGFRQGVALACDIYADIRAWRGLPTPKCLNHTAPPKWRILLPRAKFDAESQRWWAETHRRVVDLT